MTETTLLLSAADRWAQAGVPASLIASAGQVQLRIDDLPGDLLSAAFGNTIIVDRNAAGLGWFIDTTPNDDSEFTATANDHVFAALSGSKAAGRVDLLTVLAHELGHLLGLDHTDNGLMEDLLSTSTRRTPSAADVDALFTIGRL